MQHLFLWAVLLLGTANVVATSSLPPPCGLRTEHLESPAMGINTLRPRLAFVPCLGASADANNNANEREEDTVSGAGLQRNRGVNVQSFAVSVYRLFAPGSEGEPVLAWSASGLSAGSAAGTRVQVGVELEAASSYMWCVGYTILYRTNISYFFTNIAAAFVVRR